MEELTANVRGIIEKKKEEFLEQVLMDGFADLPKPCNQLHLYCLKVFQMFFNSSNLYDSNMELLGDIGKAIYIPLEIQSSKSLLHLQEPKSKKVDLPLKFQNSKPNLKPLPLSPKVPITNCHINRPSNHLVWSTNLSMHRLPKTSTSRNGYWKMTRPGPNFSVCFFWANHIFPFFFPIIKESTSSYISTSDPYYKLLSSHVVCVYLLSI